MRRLKNASLLAQDLCDNVNATIRNVAVRDVGRILHLKEHKKQTIVGWLNFDWHNKRNQIFPLVLE